MMLAKKLRAAAALSLAVVLVSGTASDGLAKSKASKKPNIVVILMDDMGYSDLGLMGSEIRTPTIDALAARGRLFTNYYVYPRCSPTRAAFLTSRYPHAVGLALLTTPPGAKVEKGPYQGYLDKSAPTLAERLRPLGYRSYLAGKWHLGEGRENWPVERGFDHYFGLISGASSYWELVTEKKRKRTIALDGEPWPLPANGFYMTDAITDHAVQFINEGLDKDPQRPFFLYLAYTAPHFPLHAPEEDVRSYDHVYDEGWEVVRERRIAAQRKLGLLEASATPAPIPSAVGRWADQTPEARAAWIRKMQVYAAMISHADRQIGRVVEDLRRRGQLDNTIIMLFSDNGASAETVEDRGLNNPAIPVGQKGSYDTYGPGGAFLSNAPLHGEKTTSWEGGVRTPLVVSWPSGMSRAGSIDRKNLLSVFDLSPTLLNLAGGQSSRVSEFEGSDIANVLFRQGRAADRPIYWEHLGWRGIRVGKWKIVSEPKSDRWQLFDISVDPGETNDVAVSNPELVAKLRTDWQGWSTRVGAVAKSPSDEDMMQLFPGLGPRLDGIWTHPGVVAC